MQRPGQRQIIDVVTGTIRIGSGLAVARQRAMNQTRVELLQLFAVKSEPCEYAGAIGFKQYIGVDDQLGQCIACVSRFEVQFADTLAPIQVLIDR